MTARFPSVKPQNSTFRVLTDALSLFSLMDEVIGACGPLVYQPTTTRGHGLVAPYNHTVSSYLWPEQTIQYYRASSVALTLDHYNNTAVFLPEGTPAIPLPKDLDTALLACLNDTIGGAVPLVEDGIRFSKTKGDTSSSIGLRVSDSPIMSILALAYLVWCILGSL